MPPPPPWFNPPPPPPAPEPEETTLDEQFSLIFRTTLTRRHQIDSTIIKFILAYVECRHIGQAAKEVGITTREGNNLIAHKDIYESVRKISELSAVKDGYEAQSLVNRMREVVDFDPIEILNDDGSFKLLSEMRPEARRVLTKFKLRNIYEEDANGIRTGKVIGQTLEVEVAKKEKPTEFLSRDKGIFKETKKIEHDIAENMASTLLGSVRRAENRMIEMAKDVTPTEGETDEVQNVWPEGQRA